MFQRKILYAILFVFILCGDGFLIWLVEIDRQRTEARGQALLEASARLLAVHGTSALEASDGLLKRMADTVEHWDLADPATGHMLWRRTAAHVQDSPQVGSAWIVDAAGDLVLENWGFPVPAKSFAFRDYFQAHTGDEIGLFLGRMQVGTTHGATRFTVSRAVRHPDGRLKAVVVAGIFSAYFAQGFQEAALPAGSRVALLSDRGDVLARWPDDGATGPASEESRIIRQPLSSYPAVIEVTAPFAPIMDPWLRRAVTTGTVAGLGTVLLALLVMMGVRGLWREEAYRRRLEAANHELEGRVAARTFELNRALDRAHAAGRAKDLFLATVSHDLRQPLQAMALLADVVSATARDDNQRSLAAQVSNSLTYGQRLLGDLVDLAQLEAGVAKVTVSEQPVDAVLGPLVEEARHAAVSQGVSLSWCPSSAIVRSDPDRLRQMIQNLLSNAIKNTPQGGRVLVGCRRLPGAVRIGVWDTGPGIPADKLDVIFEQFYQLGNEGRNSAEGVGLGLAIVRRTADLLGHRVVVESRPGKGSMFAVEVPLAAGVRGRKLAAA